MAYDLMINDPVLYWTLKVEQVEKRRRLLVYVDAPEQVLDQCRMVLEMARDRLRESLKLVAEDENFGTMKT